MMNALNLKGIGNVYPIDTEAHAKKKGIPATGNTRWDFLGGELGLPELDARIGEILKRDDKFEREQFLYAYEASHSAIVKTNLRQIITQARGAAINRELRPEVRDGKIIVAASEGLAVVRVALEPVYQQFAERVSQCQKIYDAALQPTGDPVELALRAREVRDALRRGDRGQAGLALMKAAQAGSLVAVHAAAHDPLGTEIVPPEVLEQAQRVALNATGMGWIWRNLEDEMDLLPELGGRFDMLESLLLSVFGAPPFSVKLSRPESPAFFNMAVAHVEALSGTTKPVSTVQAA